MYNFFWDLFCYLTVGKCKSDKMAQKVLIDAQDLNPVWQKFCQYLACRDDLIGEVLANKLTTLLDQCPIHDHKYTIEKIKEEMPDEDFDSNFTQSTLIGSGTIAQVYRIYNNKLHKWVAIKIKHPNIIEDIEYAREQFNNIAYSIWFPKNLRYCGEEFFRGICQQENFKLEFESGLKFSNMIHELQNNSGKPNVFIIPKMLRATNSIIMMDYEPGDYDLLSLLKLKSLKHINLIIKMLINIQVVSIYKGLIHSDLHWGNLKIRFTDNNFDNFQIIIYDYGLVLDLNDKTPQFKHKWAQALFLSDAYKLMDLILLNNKNKDGHILELNKILDENKESSFAKNIKSILWYCQTSYLEYDRDLMTILYACIHCERLEKYLNVDTSFYTNL